MDTGFGNAHQCTAHGAHFGAGRCHSPAAGGPGLAQALRSYGGQGGDFRCEEMVGKIKAALDAREHDDTLLIARTDALGVNGLEDALERAARYREAGADVLFIEAPQSIEQMQHHWQARSEQAIPLVHNLVEGGGSPLASSREVQAWATASHCTPWHCCTGCARSCRTCSQDHRARRQHAKPPRRHARYIRHEQPARCAATARRRRTLRQALTMMTLLRWMGRGFLALTLLFILSVAFLAWSNRDIPMAQLEREYGGADLKRLEVDGVNLAYRVTGSGPPLVLIHSHFYTMRQWQRWVDALADDFTVIRYDLTSHGLTGPDPSGDYSLSTRRTTA